MAYLEGYAFAAPPFSLPKKKEQKETSMAWISFVLSAI
jgi:hypothetical protein